jgi:serine protease Do
MKKTFFYSFIIITTMSVTGLSFFNFFQSQLSNIKISTLEKKIEDMQFLLTNEAKKSGQLTATVSEFKNRKNVVERSQDQLLTDAVSKTMPAVVSIVISKDVPKLEVSYEDPFGNDPFFKGFGMKIPVYKQKGTENKKVGAGTGFIFSHDGYILTNKHVVSDINATYTVLISDGSQKTAKVIYRDQTNDIAILKIDGVYKNIVTFANSSDLKLGQSVVAIGNALGEYNNSVSVGIISGLNRTIEPSDGQGSTEKLTGVIQTDAAINPGNSGGPLIDLSGNVVGINVATIIGSSNISFSIPINTVKDKIKSYISNE